MSVDLRFQADEFLTGLRALPEEVVELTKLLWRKTALVRAVAALMLATAGVVATFVTICALAAPMGYTTAWIDEGRLVMPKSLGITLGIVPLYFASVAMLAESVRWCRLIRRWSP